MSETFQITLVFEQEITSKENTRLQRFHKYSIFVTRICGNEFQNCRARNYRVCERYWPYLMLSLQSLALLLFVGHFVTSRPFQSKAELILLSFVYFEMSDVETAPSGSCGWLAIPFRSVFPNPRPHVIAATRLNIHYSGESVSAVPHFQRKEKIVHGSEEFRRDERYNYS